MASGAATIGHLNRSSKPVRIALFVSIITVAVNVTVNVVIFPMFCGVITGQPGRQLQQRVTSLAAPRAGLGRGL